MYLLQKEILEKKKKLSFSNQPKISYEKVLLENDFFTQNSFHIQEKLKKIDFHSYYFHCYQEFSTANIINGDKLTINSKSYIWMTFKKFKKITLLQYLSSFTINKMYMNNLILTYKKLLSSLIEINKIGICYFNWNENNIFINEKEYPILSSFEYSINCIPDNSKEYWNKIISKSCNKFIPIEVCFLNEINKMNYKIITSSTLEDIYISLKNYMILNISYNEYILIFKIYINKSVEEFYHCLYKFIPTWDNYNLSILYLDLLEKYIQSNSYETKYPFIPKWYSLLKKNVSLNPIKRESLLKTQDEFSILFSTF